MFKRILSTAIASIMIAVMFTGVSAVNEEENFFSDVSPDAWFNVYVQAVKEKGLMAGITDTEFAPDRNVTRAMFVSVLYRLDGETAVSGDSVFTDVPKNEYYEKPVIWAYENGIISGITDTEFAPENEITKEQIAAILYRYAVYQGIDADTAEDTELVLPDDMEDVSDWARDGVIFCYSDGIFHGDSSSHLNPKSFAKRSETAAILSQAASLGRTLIAVPQKVKNGSSAAIAFIHDDGGKATGNWLNTVLPKYNINASVAIIGKSIDPEYNVNEPDNFEKWQVILKNSNGRLNFAVHSHGHRYLGETDNAEFGVFPDGNKYKYEAGHMTKDIADERARINQMFPDERLLAFIKPGTSYPEGRKQVSDAAIEMIKEHYIAMRNTGGEVDTLPPEDIYSVKSLMGTSSDDYTDPEKDHTAQYWIDSMDSAIEKNGMLVYLFHNIADESQAKGNSTARSRVEMLLSAMGDRIESGKIWNGKFDEIMQYTQEFDAITGVYAENDPKEKSISVKVTDSISKIDTDLKDTKFEGLDMFDYPITVKVELPYDWEYAELTQEYNDRTEILKPFTENGIRYIYANVVPDQDAAIIREANLDEYVSEVRINDAPIKSFTPSKFYYSFVLPYGTPNAPEITVDNEKAEIQQVQLDENGEGSAFVTLGKFRYEFYFSTQKAEKEALLRIDTLKDDKSFTATKRVLDYLQSVGESANITNKKAFDALSKSYKNIEYCDTKDKDNLFIESDDKYSKKTGDYMPDYNTLVTGYTGSDSEKFIITIHPEEKGDLLFTTFKDQIEFLKMNNVKLVTQKCFYSDTLYVLAIGNSFSDDSLRRLKDIAAADGVKIKSYNAYMAGRPLNLHYDAWLEETDYRIDVEGASKYEQLGAVHEFTSLKNIVSKYDWDYITLQGTTHYNYYDEGLWGVDAAETEKYWTTIRDGVAQLCPDAKRLVSATWSPSNELTANVNDGMFKDGVPDARGAYIAAILPHQQLGADIYSTEARADGGKAYIPTGVAIDYLVRYYHFPECIPSEQGGYDNSPSTTGVYRDTVCHLTDNVGRVLAGLVWYEMLTGNPATQNKYQRSTLSPEDMAKLKEAAHYACQNYMNYDPSSIGAINQ